MQRLKKFFAYLLILVFALTTAASAREAPRDAPGRFTSKPRAVFPLNSLTDDGIPRTPPRSAAGADTTVLGFWDFDAAGGGSCDAQGWISVDRTAQIGDFFHVDDFAGLGGGDFGRLIPLEGNQSLWCGARPDLNNEYLCGYATLPGYGNIWDQAFCTASCLVVSGDVSLDFLITWDSEPGYDYTYVEYDTCADNWTEQFAYDDIGTGFASHVIDSTLHAGNLRIRFHFVSDGAWSDGDGLWDTDGGAIIDSLTVSDGSGVVLATELFEVESVGDNDAASGNWVSCTPPGYGDFAGLYPGGEFLQDNDECTINLSCLWAFVSGSTYDYSCGGHAGQVVVPYENERGQYIHNEIWSPVFPITGSGQEFLLTYDTYYDLSLGALIWGVWHVRSIVDGCPGAWRDYGFVYYGGFPTGWYRNIYGFGQYVDPGATHLQIALGARDMCLFWGGIYGDCQCHSHSPLYDNVAVYRVVSDGPSWQVRDLDLFQDTFSANGTITGTARADAANDILPGTSAGILPGDSVSVTVIDFENGLDFHIPGDSSSGPAVYCFVSVDGPTEAVTGAPLVDDPRYDAVGTQMVDGRTWTQIQMDSSYTAAPSVVADDYNIDLNDNLFVPGDTVWFFFGARSAPPSSKWTYHSLAVPTTTGETDDLSEAAAYPDEFTILPAGGDILYVDGMNFRGAQPFFDWSFQMMDVLHLVDRYDIRGPSSAVANHPGSRVVDAFQQIIPIYAMIIWNTGDLITAFGDGTGTPDKSDDTGLLFTYMNNLGTTGGGVYLSGDDVADEWLNTFTGASAIQLRTTYMNFNVVTGNHVPTVGISPYGVGTAAGVMQDAFGPDTLVAYGGCPLINDFDVIDPQGTAIVQMEYHGNGNTANAIVSQATPNAATPTNVVGFMLSGFSYHYIRDARPAGIPARAEHLHRIVCNFMLHLFADPVGTGPTKTAVNSLGQNHPNPFNPTTTIDYSIAQAGHVSLKVYNVAGQLVRTLVDEVQSPETVEPVIWDGRNEAGQAVSSGVYFYKLTAKGYQQTKKMVLLK
jgi:hypothetical protein